MKKFSERNLRVIAVISALVLIAAVLVSLDFSKLSLFNSSVTYHAELATAVGLNTGDEVTVAGVKEGTVTSMRLDGASVRVSFSLSPSVHLGTGTTLASKVLTPIGEQYLELTPGGPGRLRPGATIGRNHTSVPSTLVGDLNQLGTVTGKIDIGQLAKSIEVTNDNLEGLSKTDVTDALGSLSTLSQDLGSRQQELSTFVTQADALSGVLANHTSQLTSLIGQSNLVLQVLNERQSDIQKLLTTTSGLSQQLQGILNGHQAELTSLINNLNSVSGVLAHDSSDVGQALPLLAAFSRYGANVAGSGPYVDTEIPTFLVPDNALASCLSAEHAPGFNPIAGCRS